METNIPYHLIASGLDGSINNADKAMLDAWLNERPENRVIFDEHKKLWANSGQLSQNFSPDAHAALKKTRARLDVAADAKTVHLKRFFPMILKIAAGLAMIVITGYFYFTFRTPELITAESNSYEKLEIITNEGTKIILNSSSKLMYPAHFKGNERKVRLVGEAFFEVAKDSIRPFIVEALGSETKVLGTKFNLKANSNDSLIILNLVEGKVNFLNRANNEHAILTAGDRAIMNCISGKIYKENQDSKNFESWRSGKLLFENSEMTTVIKELGEYYGKKIVLSDTSLRKLRLYGSFNNQPLSEVTKAIEEALNVQFIQNGNTIEVSSR